MKRFIIERDVPGAAELSDADVVRIARKSNATTQSLGVPYRWITSYVADDKIYCIHEAEDEDVIREHCRRSSYRASIIAEIACEFGPSTAESAAI
jgi:hypothetical protein